MRSTGLRFLSLFMKSRAPGGSGKNSVQRRPQSQFRRPRLPAACLAPDCRILLVRGSLGPATLACPPVSRVPLLATLSPREGVWPGRSARAPGLPPHSDVRRAGETAQSALRCCLSLVIIVQAQSQPLQAGSGQRTLFCPGPTAPGALPLAQRLRLPPGPTTVVAPTPKQQPPPGPWKSVGG